MASEAGQKVAVESDFLFGGGGRLGDRFVWGDPDGVMPLGLFPWANPR
jgi:hypothetical protein